YYCAYSLHKIHYNMPTKRNQISPGGAKASTPKTLRGKTSASKVGGLDVTAADELESWMKAKQLIKPEDQLELSLDELREEIARVLTSVNPQLPQNIVEYSFKESSFVPVPPVSQMQILQDIEGTILHKESEEGRAQLAAAGLLDYFDHVFGIRGEEEFDRVYQRIQLEEQENRPDENNGSGFIAKNSGSPVIGSNLRPKKLTNQFNFCERAALTYNNPCRDLETQTIPPPRDNFSGHVMQWIIYDAYQEDYEAQQKEKEKEKKEKPAPTQKMEVKKKEHVIPSDMANRTLKSMKIIERMVNQNTFDEIAQDYRYWEDPSDEYRDGEGTLLPLWKFVYEKTKKNNVTSVVWSPGYYDIFAVGFGCFDFMKPQPEGALCLFTLKNPSFPEYVVTAETGVVCVDIHPKYTYLICVGKYDGNVAVYDAHAPGKEPQYESNSVTNKHCGIVWQVHWGHDMPDGVSELFLSVSRW
ncbi:hypothetical protein L9F63_014954, partial [Diploptera punctata]